MNNIEKSFSAGRAVVAVCAVALIAVVSAPQGNGEGIPRPRHRLRVDSVHGRRKGRDLLQAPRPRLRRFFDRLPERDVQGDQGIKAEIGY